MHKKKTNNKYIYTKKVLLQELTLNLNFISDNSEAIFSFVDFRLSNFDNTSFWNFKNKYVWIYKTKIRILVNKLFTYCFDTTRKE